VTTPTHERPRLVAPSPSAVCIVSVPGRGRGVAAARAIARGERIERAPVIVLSASELAAISTTRLARYYFEWGEDDSMGAIVLGYGSLYNHSFEPNAEYEFREDELAIDYLALRDIAAGEEITINYNNTGEHAAHPIQFD
jgi:SET domain-containing protein